MEKNKLISDLDKALTYLYNHPKEGIYDQDMYSTIYDNDYTVLLTQIIDKLYSDGFISKHPNETPDANILGEYYFISLEGILFFERFSWIMWKNSPYANEQRSQIANKIWIIIKIFGASAIALATLIISIIALSKNSS